MARLGIIGVGNMGGAIAKGLLSKGFSAADLVLCESDKERRREIVEDFGCETVESPSKINAESILLATKPNDAIEALQQTPPSTTEILSIVAGLSIATIRAAHQAPKVIRAMPNMPAQIGMGATGLSGDRSNTAEEIFAAVGTYQWVDESLIDAITAVSGSGPAYLFFLAEQMIQAAVALGISSDDATKLVTQTLRGSAELLAIRGDPRALRDAVTSPGGTTQAAFEVLTKNNVAESLQQAIGAAARRSKELGS